MVFVLGQVVPNVAVRQVFSKFHPVPATTEIDEADLVGEESAERAWQRRMAAASEGSVVEWQAPVLDRDDYLTGPADDANVVPPFLFRLERTIDDVATDRPGGPTKLVSIRIMQSELVSNPTHKVDHDGQKCSGGQDRDASNHFLEFRRPALICDRQCLLTGPESASKGLEVAYLSRLALELVAKLRVGDTYELAGSLPNTAAAKLGHAVLGNDEVHHVLEGRHRRARV